MPKNNAPDSCAVPLGRTACSRGELRAIRPRYCRLLEQAWFTRKLSVLLPAESLRQEDAQGLRARLQKQMCYYELAEVPLAALGDEGFAQAVKDLRIACLSRGGGLDVDNVVAITPAGELIASIDGLSFQRLGIEEPAAGSKKLRNKLQTEGHRHVRMEIGVSRTRQKKAHAMSVEATSRWRSLIREEERCSLTLCIGQSDMEDFDFRAVLGPSVDAHRKDVSSTLQGISFAKSESAESIAQMQALTCTPEQWQADDEYCEACEQFFNWLGEVHLGLHAATSASEASSRKRSQEQAVDAWLWQMGEALISPEQLQHTFDACVEVLSQTTKWFVISFWGDEDAPVSHTGSAHGFDMTGAHHVHLIVNKMDGVKEPRCLLLEASNALDATC